MERRLEKRHSHVSQCEEGPAAGATDHDDDDNDGKTQLEGYLFKRGQNAFKVWNRRWFYLKVGVEDRPVVQHI